MKMLADVHSFKDPLDKESIFCMLLLHFYALPCVVSDSDLHLSISSVDVAKSD